MSMRSVANAVHRVEFSELDEFAAALRSVKVELLPRQRTVGPARILQVSLPHVTLERVRQPTPAITNGACGSDWMIVHARAPLGREPIVNGHRLAMESLMMWRPSAAIYERHDDPSIDYTKFTIPPEYLENAFEVLAGENAPSPNGECMLVDATPQAIAHFMRTIDSVSAVAADDPVRASRTDVRASMEHAIMRSLIRALTSRTEDGTAPRHAPRNSPERIMKQVADYLHANMAQPVYVAELCAATGVSERTLRTVFQKFCGMGPCRYLTIMRLKRVRHMLLTSQAGSLTVTQAATRWGFWELGRFAVQYRQLFGESPNRTLRGQL